MANVTTEESTQDDLLIAVKDGDAKEIRRLIDEHSADANRNPDPRNRISFIHIAAKHGRCEVVRLLFDFAVDCKSPAKSDACIKQLVSLGANFDVSDRWGLTPIALAIQLGRLLAIRTLAAAGANMPFGRCTPSHAKVTLKPCAKKGGHEKLVGFAVGFPKPHHGDVPLRVVSRVRGQSRLRTRRSGGLQESTWAESSNQRRVSQIYLGSPPVGLRGKRVAPLNGFKALRISIAVEQVGVNEDVPPLERRERDETYLRLLDGLPRTTATMHP